MLSLQLIREIPALVRRHMARRGADAPIDAILVADVERRRLQTEADNLRAHRNEVSKQIGAMKQKPPELIAEMRQVGDRIKELDAQVATIEADLNALLLQVPNLVDDRVPSGADERSNVVVEAEQPREQGFPARPHWELGEALGIIDFERGVRLSGTRFYVLRGLGARLQRALIALMLDIQVNRHGYTEIYPPYMVKREVMQASGQLPKFEENLYRDIEDDLWMIPTAEVPLTSLHAGEILPPGSLPINYVAYTPCFRREKMSAGRDVRGLKRGHQFDKVEMYKFVEPHQSSEALDRMVEDARDICRALGLRHRLLQLCSGDLSFAATMTYDIEVWAPGVGEWLEVSSVSNCGDFQAHRANIRYRPETGARPEYVHTLNGSGLALPRVMIAVIENYQQPDGSIVVPDALRPFMGGVERIG
ncbi:MAG: serine--tRNA ligase [Chloroflexi bacterium]|nr:serine--tRNA ligase [Chloroflexota bacterium]